MNRREFVTAAALSALRLPGAQTLTVEAGRFDRRDLVVSFPVPAGVDGKSMLRDESGKTTALQIDAGQASFVLLDLKAGKTKQYRIVPASSSEMRVKATADERLLRVTSGADRIFDFRLQRELPEPEIKEALKRAGYMHPVYSPGGRVVTDDYPSDHSGSCRLHGPPAVRRSERAETRQCIE
jgi:hypothetical protein